jgi:hypothetical protein
MEKNIISLVGMSGVGKTHYALSQNTLEYFHYSVDYVIAKDYLRDKYFISSNVKVEDLSAVSDFLGKFGSKNHNGLDRKEFLRRQKLYADAEKEATLNLRNISKDIFSKGYKYIVNDLTGSICEILNDEIADFLKKTNIKYFPASSEHLEILKKRAKTDPKPLLFNVDFFEKTVESFKREKNIKNDDDIIPDEFCIYSFPLLLQHRIPKYEEISKLQ